VWLLHQDAKTNGQRPSALMGIESAWVAYEFDAAVGWFGRYVESRMEETQTKGGGKQRRTVPKWTMEQILRGDPLRKQKRVIRLNDWLDGMDGAGVIDL
jgi:hypothetical protein